MPSHRRLRKLTKEERHGLVTGLLFISPWVLGFLAFRIVPFVMSLYYSFTFFPILESPKWIGLANFRNLFTDGRFVSSLYNTAYYAFFAVPLGAFFGILLAMLLNMKVKAMSIWRTIFYLPSITPVVATALVWLWMFNPRGGIINYVISLTGLRGPGWLGDPVWAKPALILMSLWGVGTAVVIYLAALQDVPRELVEASQLDGAHVLQQIRYITLPMISPVILFNVITGLIGAFQFFTEVHVMTGGSGSPADSTLMMSIYLWQSAFQFFKMGYASAQAWIMFVIIVVFTVIMFRVSGRAVYYGGR